MGRIKPIQYTLKLYDMNDNVIREKTGYLKRKWGSYGIVKQDISIEKKISDDIYFLELDISEQPNRTWHIDKAQYRNGELVVEVSEE